MATLEQAWAATSGTVPERLAALKLRAVPQVRPIVAAEIKKLWSRWMVLARCKLFVDDNSPAVLGDKYTPELHGLRVICQATADNLQGNVFSDLDPTEPKAALEIAAYLGGLVAAGVLTEEQRDATLALGTYEAPEFVEVGLPDLHKLGLISDDDAGLSKKGA